MWFYNDDKSVIISSFQGLRCIVLQGLWIFVNVLKRKKDSRKNGTSSVLIKIKGTLLVLWFSSKVLWVIRNLLSGLTVKNKLEASGDGSWR